MSQIISLNICKVGIGVGQRFLDLIAKEHFQQQQQPRGKYHVFFQQTQTKFSSRNLFFDIDSRSIQNIKMQKQHYFVKQSNLFKGSGLNNDLFFSGNYSQGSLILEEALQTIRKQVQKCERLSGFLLINGIGGGTESGMASCLVSRLRELYCSSIVQQHLAIPQSEILHSPIKIYNTVLSFQYFIQLQDLCFLAENQAFQNRLFYQRQLRPTIQTLNIVHAQNIVQSTSPYRFGGNLNSNQRKICTNLLLFPRMKFIVSSFSNKNQKHDHLQSTFKQKNFSKSNYFSQSNGICDIYAMQINCRDSFLIQHQIDVKVKSWMKQSNIKFSDFLPHSVHTSIIQSSKSGPSSNCLINSKNVVKLFKKWSQLFSKSYQKQAFLHHYLDSGMDKFEFMQAESNLNDLVSEYEPSSLYCDDDQFNDQYGFNNVVQE